MLALVWVSTSLAEPAREPQRPGAGPGSGGPALEARVREILAGSDAAGTDAAERIGSALFGLGTQAIPVLLRALDSPATTPGAVQEEALVAALSRFRRGGLIEALVQRASRPMTGRERTTCVRLLGAVGEGRDLLLLARAAAGESPEDPIDPGTARVFEHGVVQILGRDPAAIREVGELLQKASPSARQCILRALGDAGTSAALNTLARELGARGEEDRIVLTAMARAARSVPPPVDEIVAGRVRSYLRSEDPGLIEAAATCLGEVDDFESFSDLVGLLRHEHPDVRRSGHAALRTMTGMALLPDPERWEEWRRSETKWYRNEAPRLLAQMESGDLATASGALGELAAHPLFRPDLVGRLSPVLHHRSPEMRRLGCAALRQLGWRGAIPSLLELLEDPDPRVVAAARAALDSIRAGGSARSDRPEGRETSQASATTGR